MFRRQTQTQLVPCLSSSSPTAAPADLPVELLREILSHADTPSLVACCQVNWILLEIAAEVLYQDVELVGLERLRRMFNVETQSSPHISSLLSLRQIRTFTFSASTYSVPSLPILFTSRRGPSPLPIHTLSLRVYINGPPLPLPPGSPPAIIIYQALPGWLYRHFDPRVVRYHPMGDPRYRFGLQLHPQNPTANVFSTSPNGTGGGQRGWTRLKEVQLVQATIQPVSVGEGVGGGQQQEQWIVSSSSPRDTAQLSVSFPDAFRVGPGGIEVPCPELDLMVQIYVGLPPHAPLDRGPGRRAFRRVEIVVGSEMDRVAVIKFVKAQASRGDAVGVARIQEGLERDELGVVVRDLSSIVSTRPMANVFEPSQKPLAYSVTLPPAPVLPPHVVPRQPASESLARLRTPTADRDAETAVSGWGSALFSRLLGKWGSS